MLNEGYRVSDDSPESEVDYFKYLRPIKYQLLFLFIATLVVYFNSLSAPFYLDDHHSIVENPAIKSFSNLIEHRNYQIMRFTGYFSLAVNYNLHEYSVAGYHIFNLLIHFLTGVSIYFLIRALLNSPKIQANESLKTYLPFLTALLFLLHPLHTQAITYIVQRHAALAAMFYLLTLYFYVTARNNQNLLFYVLTGLAALLALLSKENTVTLPAAILLIEVLFFQTLDKKKMLIWAASGLFSALILGFILFQFFGVSFELIDQYTHTQDTRHISRLEYFATQMLVLWHYIKLYFVPIGLHLEYDLILQKSFFSLNVLLALVAHIAVIAGAIIFAKKHPLIIFAVIFYYLTHIVESGVIPLRDFAFEHRTYLPDMGLSLLLAWVLIYLKNIKPAFSILTAIILLSYAYLTIERNSQWADPVEFYLHETKMSPKKERVWAELGKIYMQQKDFDKALKSFGVALNIGRDGDTIQALPTTFLNTYLALLYSNQLKKAIYFESIMPVSLMSPHDRSVYYYMRGNRLAKSKQSDQAIQSFKTSLENNPDNLNAKANMAALLIEKGQVQHGKLLINQVLQINPNHKQANIYLNQYKDK